MTSTSWTCTTSVSRVLTVTEGKEPEVILKVASHSGKRGVDVAENVKRFQNSVLVLFD